MYSFYSYIELTFKDYSLFVFRVSFFRITYYASRFTNYELRIEITSENIPDAVTSAPAPAPRITNGKSL